jgi:hypothetical protein
MLGMASEEMCTPLTPLKESKKAALAQISKFYGLLQQ